MYRFIRFAMGLVAIALVIGGGSGCGDSTPPAQTTKTIKVEKKSVNKGGGWQSRKVGSPNG
jgi:hypothetical protein